MTLTKVTYTDTVTRINANNLNEIQDHLITLENEQADYGNMTDTYHSKVATMATGSDNIDAVEILGTGGPYTFYPITAQSGDGYCRMADGTLICWGSGDFGTISANDSIVVTVTFPKAFKDVDSYTLIAYGAYHYPHTLEVVGTKYNAGSCRIYGANRTVNVIDQYALYSWVAIGRWRT